MPSITVPFQIACMKDTCGITESNPPGAPTATVVFTCDSSNHYQLVRDLLGYPIAAGLEIIRTYPFQYPPSPNLIATAIDGVEFYGPWIPVPGVGLPWLWRKKAKVTCRFELPLWYQNGVGDPSGLPYTTTSVDAQGNSSRWRTHPTSSPLGSHQLHQLARGSPRQRSRCSGT